MIALLILLSYLLIGSFMCLYMVTRLSVRRTLRAFFVVVTTWPLVISVESTWKDIDS